MTTIEGEKYNSIKRSVVIIQLLISQQQFILSRNIMFAKREILNEDLSFIQGDIVLAKCPNSFPEPAIISCFRGIDEEDHEVYKIKFIVGQQWAYLQHYNMKHLSLKNIRELSEQFERYKKFQQTLGKAEILILNLGDSLAGNCLKRFEKLYLSQEPFDQTFFEQDTQELRKGERSSIVVEQILKKKKKKNISLQNGIEHLSFSSQNKCKITQYMKLIVNIYHVNSSTLKIEIQLNDFISGYQQKDEFSQLVNNQKIIERSEKTEIHKKSMLKNIEKHIDNKEFANIQEGLVYNFEEVQRYMTHLQKLRNFELKESFEILQNININARSNDIKEYIHALLNYNLTIKQIERTLTNIKEYFFDFIEQYSIHFLFRNINKIKQLSLKLEDNAFSFENVPILSIFEFIDYALCIWLDQAQKQLNKSIISKSHVSGMILPTSAERVKESIVTMQEEYSIALAPLKELLRTLNS